MNLKKSQSLMVSYVILVAIVIALSIGVYSWLKYNINISPVVDCEEGTSVILSDIECSPSEVKLNLKNNGRFSVDGIILTVSEKEELITPTYLVPSREYNQGNVAGSYFFDFKLNPAERVTVSYSLYERKFNGTAGFGQETKINFTEIKTVQIQPFIITDTGVVVCQDALIKQIVDCSFETKFCSPSDLASCYTPEECVNAGGYWWPDNTCKDSEYLTSLSGLISLWKFENNTEDITGNHDGTYCKGSDCSAVPVYVKGKLGQSIQLNGINNYVKSSGFSELGISNQPYSFVGLIKSEPELSEGNIIHVSKDSDGKGWCVSMVALSSENKIRAYSWPSNVITNPIIANDGDWHFFANTWDNVNGLRLYVDNQLVNKSQPTYSASGTSNYVWLGFTPNSCAGDTSSYFKGEIDEISVFNRALSESEIQNIYNYYFS